MGAFAPSLYEWVGSSKAESGVADLGRLAAWVFVPGRYACPGWEWVPSIAIAWGRMLAGCALHVLDEFRGGIPACNEREQTI